MSFYRLDTFEPCDGPIDGVHVVTSVSLNDWLRETPSRRIEQISGADAQTIRAAYDAGLSLSDYMGGDEEE
jgi:hypothetical protein